jgi:hypothetical protein
MEKNDKNKEIISQFMGFEKIRIGYYGDHKSDWGETEWQVKNRDWIEKMGIDSIGDYVVNLSKNEYREWEDVAYDTSWDWLVPVVEKIENLNQASVDIYYNCCEIAIPDDMIRVDGHSKIESTYKAVIEFIKWYNASLTKPSEV